MISYLAKRLLAMVPTLLGITVITFFVISIAPGDPVQASFETSSAGDGADQAQDRLADTIKAKKQLLGLMTEDPSVHAYSPAPTMAADRAATMPSWGRVLASQDGRILVGDDQGEVSVWKASGAERIGAFQAHEEAIFALAVHGTGEDARIATASTQGAVAVHTLAGERVVHVAGTGKPVRGLAFAGQHLYAVCDDGRLFEVDLATGAVLRERTDHVGGATAVAVLDGVLFTGGADRRLIAVDPTTFEPVLVSEDHDGAINDIATADGMLATAADDRIARVYRVSAGSGVVSLTLVASATGHHKRVTAVAFSSDGATLFTGGDDELVRSFDTSTAEQTGTSSMTTGRVAALVAHDGQAMAVGEFWRKVPITTQYLTWLGRILTLDFGRSFVDDEPVMDKISRALPITLGLNVLAILIIYGVSIPVGIYAAMRRGQAFDNASSLFLFVLYSIPNFWLATMLIMFFSSSRALDIFPSGKLQVEQPWDLSYLAWLGDIAWHLVLPVTVMVYAGFASLSRYVRTSMLEALSQDFVRTARAKGLAETVVVLKHAFRNALITIITLVGNLLPRMIGGSVIVEYIFSIDGMGRLGFDAILSRDYPVIMAITTFAALLTLLGILLSDLLYGAADPRVRLANQ